MTKQRIWLNLLGLLLVMIGCSGPADRSELGTTHPALGMKPVPAGLGVNIHFYTGTEQDWRLLEAANVGIVRMDVTWGKGEPRPGQYDFSEYDTLLARLKRRGMRLLFIIDYGNPNYGNSPPTTQAQIQASVRFVSALVRHFAGEPVIWELWNEPNLAHFWPPKPDVDAYVRWCKAVVPAIRAQDPKACVIGPATSRVDLQFLEECFKRGYLELVDGVSVHPYRGADRGPETVLPEYEDLRTLIAEYAPAGKKIPILSGEWGYSTTRMSRELQGKYLPRQWLTNLSAGVPVSIWYDWHDDGRDPKDPEHNFGTVTWDYKPKPAYLAMRTLTAELDSTSVAARLPLGKADDFVLAFEAPDSSARLAVWTTGSPHGLDLGPGLHVVRAVNHLGQPLRVRTDPTATLNLTDAPAYLTVVPPFPDWLDLALEAAEASPTQAKRILASVASGETPEGVGSFGRALIAALHAQDACLRHTAWSAVVDLLARTPLSDETTLRVAEKVARSDLPVVGKARLVHLLTRRAPLQARSLVRDLPSEAGLARAKASFSFEIAYLLARENQGREAEAALLEGLRGSSERHLARRVLQALSEHDSTVSKQIPQLARQAGFVSTWWVAGPFPKKPGQRFFPERRFNPGDKQDTATGSATWRKVTVDNLWGVVDFGQLYGRKPGIAYARTELIFPEATTGTLKVGSNDGVVLFLNGRKIHEKLVPRGLTVDQDVVPARFRKGKNVLLAKVVNEGANWQLCVRVCDENGRPLDISELVVE